MKFDSRKFFAWSNRLSCWSLDRHSFWLECWTQCSGAEKLRRIVAWLPRRDQKVKSCRWLEAGPLNGTLRGGQGTALRGAYVQT
jgi:hypothetical protein